MSTEVLYCNARKKSIFFFFGEGVCQGCSAVRNRVILTTAKGHIIDGFKKKIKNNKKEIDNNK